MIRTSVLYGNQKKINTEAVNDYPQIRFERKFPIVGLYFLTLPEETLRNLCPVEFFCLFGQRFLSNPRADSRHILHAGVPPPPVGSIGPWWAGGGGVKNSKNWGWSHSCCGQLPFLFFSAMPNVVQYVGHRPAHTLV